MIQVMTVSDQFGHFTVQFCFSYFEGDAVGPGTHGLSVTDFLQKILNRE